MANKTGNVVTYIAIVSVGLGVWLSGMSRINSYSAELSMKRSFINSGPELADID